MSGDGGWRHVKREGWSKDEDHLVRITELVGDLPRSIIKAGCYGSRYYEGGRLKNVDQKIIKAYSLLQVRWVPFNVL